MKRLWRCIVLATLITGLCLADTTPDVASAKGTTALRLHITGFGSDQGKAMVAIANSKQSFDTDGKPFISLILPIQHQEVDQTLSLPFGEYAVKIFHDANGNEHLDTLIFGIPRENTGFPTMPGGLWGHRPMKKPDSSWIHPNTH